MKQRLLNKIEELSKKQIKPKPISVDTLALALKVTTADLEPLLTTLVEEGLINLNVPDTMSKRMSSKGNVTFVKRQ